MMQIFSFGIITILALAGIGFVGFGIIVAEFKPAAVRLFLIFGVGVFAMLCMGTRWISRLSEFMEIYG